MGFRKDFLWGGAVAAHQLEGAYDRDGKGLSIMDVVTSGDVNTRRRITGEILKGENYPNHEAIDFYDHYKEDKRKRENVVFHVGTLQSEIDAFVSKLSLEEVEYNLLISAIKDSLGISTQNVLISEGLIKNSFDEIDVFPKDSSSYVDDSAFELSANGYETYKSTFIDVYQLDSRYKNRLCKKIGGKLK